MDGPGLRRQFLLGCATSLTGVLLIVGCGGDPSVSSSEEQATVKGVVTYQGSPVKKGSITFDPSNANRRSAAATQGAIGADGTYSVNSLVGRNKISLDLPGLATAKNRLNYTQLYYEVHAGENTFNVELPAK